MLSNTMGSSRISFCSLFVVKIFPRCLVKAAELRHKAELLRFACFEILCFADWNTFVMETCGRVIFPFPNISGTSFGLNFMVELASSKFWSRFSKKVTSKQFRSFGSCCNKIKDSRGFSWNRLRWKQLEWSFSWSLTMFSISMIAISFKLIRISGKQLVLVFCYVPCMVSFLQQ